MDESISSWILEFLLRQPMDERIINGVLSSLPLKDGDNRLKKTLLLRKIESETSKAAISEKILDLLEIIEEIDHRNGKSASNTMKEAYCAVAVDCTVRFLEDNVENNAKYFDAVKRIWRDRVCKMESLASEESTLKMEEIEAAVWDSEACGKLLKMNTRNEALKAVRVYLEEAWNGLGPAFLELVAQKAGNALEELRSGGSSSDLAACGEFRKGHTPAKRKHVAMRSKRSRGAKISEDNEVNEDDSMGKANDDPTPEVQRGPAAVELTSMVLDDARKVNVTNDCQTARCFPSTKVTDDQKTIVENQTCPEMHRTPEVNRVQEALKLSSMELHAVVRDPLPDALRIAETLSSTGVTDNPVSEPPLVNQTAARIETPSSACADKEREIVEKENPGSSGNEGQHGMKLRNGRRMLLEPNETAQTFEWDDSIDNMRGDSPKRPRLPSLREGKPSPSKNYEENKIVIRRIRKKWTPLEEDTLRTGVKEFGKGNWKAILHSHPEIFQDRTEVDLKDKWRNMTRYP